MNLIDDVKRDLESVTTTAWIEPQSRITRVPDLEAALLAADEHAQASDNRLGKWMSAALSDPDVCDEMKSDINAWFSTLSTYRNAVEGK